MSNSHMYGLIITDVSMPILDGFQTSQRIRSFYRINKAPQPKIVACTGHVEEELTKKAWQHEVDEIMAKPINMELLKEIFTEIMIYSD